MTDAPTMRAALRIVGGVLVVIAAASARAEAIQVMPEHVDKKILECLQPAPQALPPVEYPAEGLILKKEATVRVRLRFAAPDAPPEATVFFNQGGPAFEAPVLPRVKAYRLPCLPANRDKPYVVTQEFHFDPRDGRPVVWSRPRASAEDAPPNRCTQDVNGARIVYPMLAFGRGETSSRLSRDETGVVLARMEVTSADAEPTVRILHDAGSALLAGAVKDYLRQTRVRCDRYPIEVQQTFHFEMDGNTRYALKDMPLAMFAGFIKDLEQQKVRFDFTTMRCPFDVQLRVFQPYSVNSVGEVGEPDPNRAEFLDWLRSVSLDLPAKTAKHLLGAETRVSVPCSLLDLTQ